MKLFDNIQRGIFKSRLNRFVVTCHTDRKDVKAYLPNPGRLRELLLPGSTIYLAPRTSASHRYRYVCVAAEKEGSPVLLHTHLNNIVARHMIETGLLPFLEGASIMRPEIMLGKSRFDFLLGHEGREVLLEVKSCTLFSGRIAMFPDALTIRGRKHLDDLASLAGIRRRCAVLFIVHSPSARYFLPDYHTDLAFSKTLLSVSSRIMVKAVSVSWRRDLNLGKKVRELVIPWEVIRNETHDRGSYLFILRLKKSIRISVGMLGDITFRKGYYIYIGSAKRDLSQRIARHQRFRKNLFWHIDYLRQYAEHCASLPVRASTDLECDIANATSRISDWTIGHFGSSNCGCRSHLFGMREDPQSVPQFIKLLLDFRMNRLEDSIRV